MAETLIEKREYKDFSRGVHATGKVVKAQLELTYRCNLHCVHCYTDPYNKKDFFPRELSTPELKRIIDELADYGVFWLNFSGGEALLRPDFFELYDHAFRRGFALVLYTNGTCFTPSVIARLKEQPPFFIDVSCHSVRAEAFDRFTQVPGSLRRFFAGMELLRGSGLPFRMKTKAMDWNKDEMGEIRAFVEKMGCEFSFSTSLSPRLDGDRSSLAYRLPPDELAALETAHDIWKEDEETCASSRARLGGAPDALYRCGCATDTVHISAWGELGTCTLEYECRASLREFSVSQAVEKVFNEVRKLRFSSESPCGTCEIHSFCDRSPSQLARETGDREAATAYHCDTALDRAQRLTKKKLEHPLASRRKA
jgi:MoaA/NifB/PqqE/SkfB family radical SAM enzyme